MVSNKDINWIHAQIQSRHEQALGVEKSILGEVLGLFESAPDFQIVLTLNDASDEELRKLMEGVRHECVILPGGTELSMVELVEPENKWIPVTEGLPEHTENVLVLCTDKFANVRLEQAYLLAQYNPEDGWILEMWPEKESPNVTHWMPLPELPKEVNHGE